MNSVQARFTKARRLFFAAVEGDSGAQAEAGTILEALAKESPKDMKVQAYLGGIRLLDGKDAIAPWNKMDLCNEGLKLFDDAVRLAPDDLEIRILRGMCTRPLPFFFGRGDVAAEDVTYVAARAAAALREGQLDPSLAAAAYFFEGTRLESADDLEGARGSWRAAVEAAPESLAGRDARKKLEELGAK